MRNQQRQKNEARPLYDQAAEKFFMGAALNDPAVFWEAAGKIRQEMFSLARLGRIWAAMVKCGEANRPIKSSFLKLFIAGDLEETTPLEMFLAALRADAPSSSEAEIYRETIVQLFHKRMLIESLDQAKAAILNADISSSSEELKDIGIGSISRAFDGDSDSYLRSYGEWGSSVAKEVDESLKNEELGGVGLRPGLAAVESCIGRLLPGKLYVLAGMSSSGKSALARQIMESAVNDSLHRSSSPGSGYLCSLEMTGNEVAIRHISEMLEIPSFKIESGDVNQMEAARIRQAVKQMQRLPIKVDSKPRQNIRDITDRCRRIKNSGGLSIAVIDHLILVNGTSRNQSLMDRVSESTIESKNMAKEFNIPVIILAQLNEKRILESKSGVPNSTHLFGGETIMQNADVVFFVHRPSVILAKKEPDKGDTEAYQKWKDRLDATAKQAYVFNGKRRGGQGNVRHEMLFYPEIMKFTDL